MEETLNFGRWAKRQCRNCLAFNRRVAYSKAPRFNSEGKLAVKGFTVFSKDFPHCRRCGGLLPLNG